jgi:hypothetical protein
MAGSSVRWDRAPPGDATGSRGHRSSIESVAPAAIAHSASLASRPCLSCRHEHPAHAKFCLYQYPPSTSLRARYEWRSPRTVSIGMNSVSGPVGVGSKP